MKYFLTVGVGIFILGIASVFLYNKISKTAYVNIDQLYNGFILKEELEKKLLDSQKSRESVIDSLKSELKLLSEQFDEKNSKKIDMNLFQIKRDKFIQTEQNFKEVGESQMEEYKEQIWKRLDQYIKEYGQDKGYDYIFGAENSYNLLYCKEENNITEEIKKYVNQKYQGIIK